MFKITKREWGGETLTLETGKVARQADGAVIATYGETSVLATVVFEKKPKPGLDFFPLSVHYRRNTTPPARSPAASSSARRARPRRRR
jgi:polyribonucleotide nucleotidyltransferase